MANKTDTEVIIGGKVFTLSGNDSEEYMQRIASYINGKISDFSKIDGYQRQSVDTRNILLELNIADDYFKAKQELDELKSDNEEKEKDLYDVKHDLITSQMKVKSLEDKISKMQEENTELQKKVVQLETELKAKRDADASLADSEEDTRARIKEAVKEAVKEENEKKTREFPEANEVRDSVETTETKVSEEASDVEGTTAEEAESAAAELVEAAKEDEHIEENIESEDEDTAEYVEEEVGEQIEDQREDYSEDIIKEVLYERIEDAEVIGDEDFDKKLNSHEDADDFVQTIDGTAEVVNQEKVKPPKKHYGKRR